MMHFSNTVCFVVSVAGATKSFVVDASDASDVDQVLALAEEVESAGYGGNHAGYHSSHDYGSHGYGESSYGHHKESYGAKGYGQEPEYKKYKDTYDDHSSYGSHSHGYDDYDETYGHTQHYDHGYKGESSYGGHHKESYGAKGYGQEPEYKKHKDDYRGHSYEKYERPQHYEPEYKEYDPTPQYTTYKPPETSYAPKSYVDPKKEAQEDFWRSVAQCQAGFRFTQCMLKCKGSHCFTGVSQYKKCTMQYANEVCKDNKMNTKDCKAFAFGNTMKYLKNIASNFIDAYLQKPSLTSLSGTVKYSIAVKSVADEANCNADAYWQFSKQCNARGGLVSELDMEDCMKESEKETSALFKTPQWMKNLKDALNHPSTHSVAKALDTESKARIGNAMYDQFVGLLVDMAKDCGVLEIFNLHGGDLEEEDDLDLDLEQKTKETKKLSPGCQRPTNSQLPLGSYGLFRSQAAFSVPAHGHYPVTSQDITKEPKADPRKIHKKEKYLTCKNFYQMGKRMSETLGSSLATNEMLEMNEYLLDLAEGGHGAKKIDMLLQEDMCFSVDNWSLEVVGQNKEMTPTFQAKQLVDLPGFSNTNQMNSFPLDTIANYGSYYVTFETLGKCSTEVIKFKVSRSCCKSYATVAKEQNWDLPQPKYDAYHNSYYDSDRDYSYGKGHDYDYGYEQKHYDNQYQNQYDHRYDGYRSMAAAGHYDSVSYGDSYGNNYGDSYGNEKHWGFDYGDHYGYDSMVSDLVYSKVFVSNKDVGYVFSRDVKISLKHKDATMKLSDFMRSRGTCSSYMAGPILQDNVVCADKVKAGCGNKKGARVMPAGHYHSDYMYRDHEYQKKYEKKDKDNCLTVLQAKPESVGECKKYKMEDPIKVDSSVRALPYSHPEPYHPHHHSHKELMCDSVTDGEWIPASQTKETCEIVRMPGVDDLQAALAAKKKAFWCSSSEFACSDSHHGRGTINTAEIMARLRSLSKTERGKIMEAKDEEERVKLVKKYIGKEDLDNASPKARNLDWALNQCKPGHLVPNECTAAMRAFDTQPQLINYAPDAIMGGKFATCFQEQQGENAFAYQAVGRVLLASPSAVLEAVSQFSYLMDVQEHNMEVVKENYVMTQDVLNVAGNVVGGSIPMGTLDKIANIKTLVAETLPSDPEELVAKILETYMKVQEAPTDFLESHDIKKVANEFSNAISYAALVLESVDDPVAKVNELMDELAQVFEATEDRVMESYGQDPHYGYGHQDGHYGGDGYGHYGGDGYGHYGADGYGHYGADGYGHQDGHYGADGYGHHGGHYGGDGYGHHGGHYGGDGYGYGHHGSSKKGGYHIVIETSDEDTKDDCVKAPKTQGRPTPVPMNQVRISDGYVSQKKMIKEVCHDLGMDSEADEMIAVSMNGNCAPSACYVARYFQCLESTEKRHKHHYGKHHYGKDKSYENEGYGYGSDAQEYYRTLLEQAQAQSSPMELAGLASLGFVAGIATVALVQQGKGMMSKKRGQIASEHTNADQVQLV